MSDRSTQIDLSYAGWDPDQSSLDEVARDADGDGRDGEASDGGTDVPAVVDVHRVPEFGGELVYGPVGVPVDPAECKACIRADTPCLTHYALGVPFR